MKTRFLYFVVLALVMFMTACTDGDVYTNAIPKNASLVISADLDQMAEKGGITAEDGKTLAETFGKSAKGELSEKEMEIFNKVIADPKESGLDLQKRVYFFAAPEIEYSGLLTAVYDFDKLTSLTELFVSQNICVPFTEENGARFSAIDNKSLIVYNDKAFLVLFAGNESVSDKLKDIAIGLLANSSKDSYVSTDDFKKVAGSKSDIVLAGSLDCLPKEYSAMLRLSMPQNLALKDLAGIFSINFEKGKLQVDIETIFKSDAAKEIAKKQEKMYEGKLKGKFLEKLVGNSMLYLAATCDGKEVYSMVMENELFKSQMNANTMPFDLKRVLESLDGEFAIAVAEGKLLPQIALYAEVDGDAILEEMEDYKDALNLAQVKYGIDDDIFYISNMSVPESGKSLAEAEWSSESKGKYSYFTMDFAALADIMSMVSGSRDAHQVKLMAEYLKSFTMYADEINRSHIIFYATDTKTNVLKQIVDFGRKMSGI